MENKNFIIPTEIPFESLKGHELEECVYWLLNDMGAKELNWRVGGKGAGAPDGGRDLEAIFPIPSPDGEVYSQKWWIDPKGRNKTVEKSTVQKTILNAQGRDDLDVVVIVTNTTFSNPTRDWVEEISKKRPRPQIRLWDKNDLERLLPKHPSAVVKLFPKALSPNGLLEVTKHRLWDYLKFTDAASLSVLWKHKDKLNWDAQSYYAVLVSELANGDCTKRPWTGFMSNEWLMTTFMNLIANLLYLIHRINEGGSDQAPIVRAASFLLIACSIRFDVESTERIVTAALSNDEGAEYPKEVYEILLEPVLSTAFAELREVCASDCSRVHIGSKHSMFSERERDNYWHQFHYDPAIHDIEMPDEDEVLMLISYDTPCKIGFKVSKDKGCPLVKFDPEADYDLTEVLHELKQTAHNRSGMALSGEGK